MLRSIQCKSYAGVSIGLSVVFYLVVKSPISLSITAHEKGWHANDLPNRAGVTSVNFEQSTPTVWVIGDSHAGAYEGMVREATRELGLRYKIRALSGCSVANLRSPNADTTYCRDRITSLFAELASRYSPGDIVFLASLRGQRLSDQWGMYKSEKLDNILNEDKSQQYNAALIESREIVRHLLTLGYSVIIDTPKPVFRAPIFRCSDWFNRMNPVCSPGFEVSSSELKQIDAPVLENIRTLNAEFPSIVVWDPFPILCPENNCSVMRDGKPLYFDQDHLSGNGNQLLLPSFSDLLTDILMKKQRKLNAEN